MKGYSSARGLTLSEVIFVRLVIETVKYLRMRAVPFGEDKSGQEKVQRGIIRGMALAITKMWGNGYEPYWGREVKQAEGKAAKLAKEIIGDGQYEHEWPDDEWWVSRRDKFWRSSSDASQV